MKDNPLVDDDFHGMRCVFNKITAIAIIMWLLFFWGLGACDAEAEKIELEYTITWNYKVRADVIYFDDAETVWIKFNKGEQRFEFSHKIKGYCLCPQYNLYNNTAEPYMEFVE